MNETEKGVQLSQTIADRLQSRWSRTKDDAAGEFSSGGVIKKEFA